MPTDVLGEVIALGGLALQYEDCGLRAALRARGKFGGLISNQNERYYQFILWRAVLTKWDAVTEKTPDGWDLRIEVDGDYHYLEIKNWKEPWRRQIPSIQRDIEKFRAIEHGYIVIVSDNPPELTDENMKVLSNHLIGLMDPPEEYRFPTVNEAGRPHEFWIAGWPVLPQEP